MRNRKQPAAYLSLLLAIAAVTSSVAAPAFRLGAHAIDISPQKFPVIVNAMFEERSADRVHDPLVARCLVLDDGTNRIALAVVDTCMMPRDLLDESREIAALATGIPAHRMLISATHTHSAPSAMGCLGSRPDPDYQKFLKQQIARGIIAAASHLQPVRVGWTVVKDHDHTFCRRWIFRPDKVGNDPFGNPTVRANMHPGYENPNAIGPSGPVDPDLSLLAFQTPEGRPVALLANYSMHYYGSPLLSADYYGRFCEKIGPLIGADTNAFLAIMSQGTSGDQMWMNYGKPSRDIGYDTYAAEVAKVASAAYRGIQFRDWAPLAMKEALLPLKYRTPDESRLAWARKLVAVMGDRQPRGQPEIYAREALSLHERPATEIKLQALRIGDLGIAAFPNEVFAITGLKIKAQSPFTHTFNIELANGGDGYIPPSEQHRLGGYTTWPARTAGLEEQAEPRIVETLLSLLEDVAEKPRRSLRPRQSEYATEILNSKPRGYWRLDELSGPTARDSSGHGHHATFEDGVALHLDGPSSQGLDATNDVNRCAHFAGGRLIASAPGVGENYTVEMWFWNGLPAGVRPVTGTLFSRTSGPAHGASDQLGIGGTNELGKLTASVGSPSSRTWVLGRKEAVPLRNWHHVAFVRERERVTVYLDGDLDPLLSLTAPRPFENSSAEFVFGGPPDRTNTFEGKLDEVAVFDRSLPPEEVARHFRSAGDLRGRP
jgi:hypothetical protein